MLAGGVYDDGASIDAEAAVALRLVAGQYGTEGNADGGPDMGCLVEPRGLAVDAARQAVFIASLHSVRCLDLRTGLLSTVAGDGDEEGSADGSGRSARFNNLRGIALSPDGSELAVCDFWNHCVRQIVLPVRSSLSSTASSDASVRVAILAGGAGSPAGTLCTPNGVAYDR